MLRRFVFSGLLLSVIVGKGKAQESEVELNPVTVTASLHPVTASQTGRNVLVIKGERFSQLPVHSIDELLRYVPGIEVQARGPMGTQSDFVIRGGTFQQVLVILDGLRLNDPITGHFSSYIPIAPSEIERIEILKGASSALYGSDAVGGVIHIITKTFAAKHKGAEKNLQAQVTGGEYGLFNMAAGGFFKKGKTAVAGGILSNNADGQPQRGTNGFFNLNTASLSLNHQFNPALQLNIRSAYDHRKFAAQNYYTTSIADTADEKVATFWNQMSLIYQQSRAKVSLHSGYKTVDDFYRFNKVITPNENRSKLFQTLLTYEQGIGKSSTLITGAQYQNRSIRSNDRGDHDVKQAAAFAIWQQAIGDAFNITPAMRFDWDEKSGTEIIPQINVSYRIAAFQLRGSAGKTIRQADFTERYNNYNKTLVPALNRVGNPDVTAEKSLSYEMGIDAFAGKSFKLSASYFKRDYDDLIDYVATPFAQMPRQSNLASGGTYYLAKNIAEVETNGFETDVQFSRKLSEHQQLFAAAGLLWLHSKSSNTLPSLYLAQPDFLTNFNLLYSFNRFSLGINGLYKQRAKQQTAVSPSAVQAKISKDYFVMNAKAEAFVIKRKLSIIAQADNIFDRQYSDLLGAPMPGRWWMGGLKLNL